MLGRRSDDWCGVWVWKELPGGWETQLLYTVFVSIVAGKPEAPLLEQSPNDPCILARVRRREDKVLYEDLVKVARPQRYGRPQLPIRDLLLGLFASSVKRLLIIFGNDGSFKTFLI